MSNRNFMEEFALRVDSETDIEPGVRAIGLEKLMPQALRAYESCQAMAEEMESSMGMDFDGYSDGQAARAYYEREFGHWSELAEKWLGMIAAAERLIAEFDAANPAFAPEP